MELSPVFSARHAWCMLCASTLVVAAVCVLLGASHSESSSAPCLLTTAPLHAGTLQEPNGCRMSHSYPSYSRLELPAELKCALLHLPRKCVCFTPRETVRMAHTRCMRTTKRSVKARGARIRLHDAG